MTGDGFDLRGEEGDVADAAGLRDPVGDLPAQERLRLIAEYVPLVFWIATPEGTPEYISPRYERIWGRTIESFQDWADSIHPDDRERVVARYGKAEDPRDLEYRIVWPDGSEHWLLDRAYPIRSADGNLERVVGTTENITERRLAQDGLEQAEAHYRRLVRASPYGVYVTDREGHFLELNPAAEEIVQRSADELLGRSFVEIVPPDALEYAFSVFHQILSGAGEKLEFDVPIRRPSGEVRMLRLAGASIMSNGEAVGVHGIARDITPEVARDAQRALLQAALDNMPDAVSITSPDRRFLYVNAAHAALLGYDPSHPPTTLDEVMPDEESRQQLDEIQATLRSERRWSGRQRRQRADGTVALVSTTVFSVFDGTGDNALAVMRDATEEITREQHLRRVERLASLATLIGGVAHELNNPLTAVVGFAHLMLMDERTVEDRETLEMMAREAERAAKIVSDLRLVARNTQRDGAGERAVVDLNDVVRHAVSVRRHALETRNIRLIERLSDSLPPVSANRAQLEQVVLNLIVNAEHALARVPDRPRELTLQTRHSTLGAALHVVDNGSGIQGEHLERIFDPFFTTKAPGEGTGLGLSLVHSIVTEHGGSLRVESEPDEGAEFVVDLPRTAGSSPSPSTASRPEPDQEEWLAAPSLRVLDDDAGRAGPPGEA